MILTRGLRRAGGVRDPSYSSVGILLPFNAADYNDMGPTRSAPTLSGSPSLGGSVAGYALGSRAIFTSSEHITYPNHAGLDLGTGDFTIEAFFNVTSLAATRTMLSHGSAGGSPNGYVLRVLTSGEIEFLYGSSGSVTIASSGFVAANVNGVYYVKLGRQGSNMFRSYAKYRTSGPFLAPDNWDPTVNNTFTGGPASYNFTTTSDLVVAAGRGLSQKLVGWVSHVRVTKGVWRGYGRPTVAFPQK